MHYGLQTLLFYFNVTELTELNAGYATHDNFQQMINTTFRVTIKPRAILCNEN